jgi:Mg2+ and Co2+ transporter CorA
MLKTLVWDAAPPASTDGLGPRGPAAGGATPATAGVVGADGAPAGEKPFPKSAGQEGNGAGLPPFCRELDDPTQISDLLASPGHYLWLDLTKPSREELRLIAEEFSLHPLAVEDAAEHSQRPKIEQYDDFYLMVVFAITTGAGPAADDFAGTRVRLHEIDLFIGERYLISVHEEPFPLFEALADRWRHNRRVLDEGIGVLVYTLLDAVVDAYFPILDGIVDRIESLEEALFAGGEPRRGATESVDVRELFRVKKDLLQMRRVVAPERDARRPACSTAGSPSTSRTSTTTCCA